MNRYKSWALIVAACLTLPGIASPAQARKPQSKPKPAHTKKVSRSTHKKGEFASRNGYARPAHKSTAHKSTAHKSTAHKSTAHKSTAHKSTAHKATAHKSTAHKSTAHKSTAHKSTAHKSTAHKSTAHKATAHRTARAQSPARHNVAHRPATLHKSHPRSVASHPTAPRHASNGARSKPHHVRAVAHRSSPRPSTAVAHHTASRPPKHVAVQNASRLNRSASHKHVASHPIPHHSRTASTRNAPTRIARRAPVWHPTTVAHHEAARAAVPPRTMPVMEAPAVVHYVPLGTSGWNPATLTTVPAAAQASRSPGPAVEATPPSSSTFPVAAPSAVVQPSTPSGIGSPVVTPRTSPAPQSIASPVAVPVVPAAPPQAIPSPVAVDGAAAYPAVATPPGRTSMTPAPATHVALAGTAWSVLKQALSEESAGGKFNDFREGAGMEALKKLDSTSYMALMRELAESPDALVRRRAVATLVDVDNVGANRILKRALSDVALPVRMDAAAILGARGDRSVLEVYKAALASLGHDDRFLVLTSMKRVGQKWMVSLLRPFLHDSDPFMRVAAAEGLARLGDEEAYMLLRRAMQSESKYLRSSAYAAAKEAGGKRSLPFLLSALNDRDASIRLYAAVYLANNGNPSGIRVLASTLRSSNASLRFTAVEALAQLKDDRALQVLVQALGDGDAEVRIRAATALLDHKKGNGIEVLRAALLDDRMEIRLKAVEGARLGCPGPGEAILQTALSDASRQVRAAAVEGLSKVAEVRDRDALRQQLGSADPLARVAAAIVTLRLNDAAAHPSLTRFVRDGAPERDEIVRMMEKLKVPEMSPYLKAIALSGPETERLRAIEALGQQDAGAAAEALCAIAKSNVDEKVRVAAVRALGHIAGDLTSYLLKSLLKEDQSAAVQVEAASILGDRGVETADAVLRRAVSNGANVRAARALCKIGDAAGVPVYQQVLNASDLGERIEAAIVLYKLQQRGPLGVGQ